VHISIPIINISWHGGTRVLVQAANFFARQGHEVTVLCSRGRHASPYRFDKRVALKQVGVCTRWKYFDYVVFLLALPMALPRRSLLVATFFVTYFPVRIAAALRGVPYVYLVQDIESKYRGASGLVLNPLCNLTYRDANIIVTNPHLQERVRGEFGSSCRLFQVGPGEAFYRAATGAGKRYDVVYFLRREKWKGLERLREFLRLAAGRLSCLCLSQDEQLFEEVRFPGVACRKPADDDELVADIDSARVLFFTSHEEGFALPPLEAMARGVPTVLFRCGGPDAYIRDGGNGFYVEDERQAVAVITRLMADESLYERVSREAVATASQFRIDIGLGQLAAYLQGLHGGNNRVVDKPVDG
jgi:glycosyltransferase involved in cell wall biosynthesis